MVFARTRLLGDVACNGGWHAGGWRRRNDVAGNHAGRARLSRDMQRGMLGQSFLEVSLLCNPIVTFGSCSKLKTILTQNCGNRSWYSFRRWRRKGFNKPSILIPRQKSGKACKAMKMGTWMLRMTTILMEIGLTRRRLATWKCLELSDRHGILSLCNQSHATR